MRTSHFNPTKRQIMAVQEMVELGYTRERMRKRIVDPGTGRVLTNEAFGKAFGHLMEVDYSRGKKSFEPTDKHRKIVQLSKLCGFINEDIAALIINPETGKQITVGTLKEHFAYELDVGRNKLLVKVTDSLVRNALSGDYKSQALILKAQAAWRDGGEQQGPQRAVDAGVLIVPADASTPAQWEQTTQQHMERIFGAERKV